MCKSIYEIYCEAFMKYTVFQYATNKPRVTFSNKKNNEIHLTMLHANQGLCRHIQLMNVRDFTANDVVTKHNKILSPNCSRS